MPVRLLTKLVIGHYLKKLIDRHVPLYLVVILCYWYQHQEMTVRWGHCISNSFNVRQGGVLSPQLFNVYIDGLSDILNKSTIGGSLGGKRINHLLYADDLSGVVLPAGPVARGHPNGRRASQSHILAGPVGQP